MNSTQVLVIVAVAVIIGIFFVYNRFIEPILFRRNQEKARKDLAEHGLTPERYIATLDQSDHIGIARAKVKFGVE